MLARMLESNFEVSEHFKYTSEWNALFCVETIDWAIVEYMLSISITSNQLIG